MIQAKELRLGNWVYDTRTAGNRVGLPKVLHPTKIETIESKEYRYYEPIPLTPDILEKAGFVKQLNTYSFQDGDDYEIGTIVVDIILNDGKIRIGVYTNGHEYEYICLPILLHVHQLQNFIYALTGTDLPLTFN